MQERRPYTRRHRDPKNYRPKGNEAIDVYGSYSDEEREWLRAVDAEKRRLGKINLDCAEVLALARRLGYRLEGGQ